MRRRLAAGFLAGVMALSGAAACDREDQQDVEEVGNDIQQGVEDVGEEVEQEIDKLDKDGKDDK